MKNNLSVVKKGMVAAILVTSLLSGAPAQAASTADLQLSLSQLQVLLQNLLAHFSPSVKGASTVVVTTDSELATAIKNSTGGETIQLAPGSYGLIQIVGGTYDQLTVGATKISKGAPVLTSPVTITSQNPANPAVVKSIDVRTSDHWHFKGLAIRPVKSALTVSSAVSLTGADCSIEDSSITYGDATGWTAADWLSKAGDGIGIGGANNIVRNNTLKNVYMGIAVGNLSTGTLVKNNTVDGIGGDGMRELANNVTMDSNLLKNFKKINDNHDDCTQSWGLVNGAVSQEGIVKGVIFQNNICINNDNPTANVTDPLYDKGLQGFDSFDGSTQGWLVQNNVFAGTAYHGIAYYGALNMTIRNNTILDSDSAVNGSDNVWIGVFANKSGTILPSGNTFQNNISNKFIGYGTSSTVVNSKVVKMADYDKYFRNWRQGDVRLLPSSPIQGAGANLDPATVGSNVVVTNVVPVVPPVVVPPVVVPVVPPVATTTVPTPATTTDTTSTGGDTSSGGSDSLIDAPVVTLSISTTTTLVGSAATLTWTSTNATSCIAKGAWGGVKVLNGTQMTQLFTATGTKNFLLTCKGAGGSVSSRTSLLVLSDGSVPTVATSTATTTLPIDKQAEIARLLQLLATLQKMLLALLAHKH